MKKLLFVYNPHSGKGEIGKWLSEILCRLTRGGYTVTVHPTSAPRDGEEYIARHGAEYDFVVCSGGDGMLHELFCALTALPAPPPCGYIPAGTVNDFAASLKIPRQPLEAAELILKGTMRKIDAGRLNGRTFAYVAAFGVFTQVSYSTDQRMKNALGAAAYLIDGLKSMDLIHLSSHSVKTEVGIDGRAQKGEFILGLAGNTYSVAGLANLIPKGAQMDDGLLDYVFIRTPASIGELQQIVHALLTQNLNIPGILSGQAKRLDIRTETPVQWTLDGEFGGETTQAAVEMLEKAVLIAAPDAIQPPAAR